MKRGIATFTLDYGKCPPWLYARMVKLGREMTRVLVDEFGPGEFVKRIADPVWFQSLGTVLAFDWNASGLTTILTAALKEAIRGQEEDLGIFIAGGKGKTSRKTPDEIRGWGDRLLLPADQVKNLVYSSKMSAKVDSSLVQDDYQIYHHAFFFSKENGKVSSWAVVQQGMNTKSVTARRYHWYSERVDDFVNEPHNAIAAQKIEKEVLDLTAATSGKNRDISVELVGDGVNTLLSDIEVIRKHSSKTSKMIGLKRQNEELTLLELSDQDFVHHPLEGEKFWDSPYLRKILAKLGEEKPKSYEKLLATEGVGPKTIRALSLVGEVIYGAEPSYTDPARYSFAHGGKDHVPYPVDRSTYDETIEIMRRAVLKSKISPIDRDKAVRSLANLKPNLVQDQDFSKG